MRFYLPIITTALFFAVSSNCYSQTAIDTLYSNKDSHTNTRAPSSSYGSDSTMLSGTIFISSGGRTLQAHQRSFVEFDLSSIPSDAIILSATLDLTLFGSLSGLGTFDWKTKLITSSWTEAALTANNQPSISNLTADVVTTTPTVGSVQQMDVTDMVKRMVNGSASNFGWCVQVSNESVNATTGGEFYTRESAILSNDPRLRVQWYRPISLSNVTVTHESSNGASDGGVSFTPTFGCSGSSYSYSWVNSSGTQISTSSSLSNVSYGWYGLELTDTQCGAKLFMGFLIGTECEEVTISYTELPDYVDNNLALSHVPNNNYPDHIVFRAEEGTVGQWYQGRTYTRYYTWMDDAFTVNEADLLVKVYPPWVHFSSASPDNSGQMNLITQNWDEDYLTHNFRPTVNTSISSPVSATPVGNSTVSTTIDMTNLWNEWKTNNYNNYGAEYQLDDYSTTYNRNYYASAKYGTVSSRPEWTFKLALNRPNNPLLCGGAEMQPYNKLKKELDGGYAESYNDTLNFTFIEDYSVDASLYLVTTIYNDDHIVEATCDANGNTTSGMPALQYNFDDNRYVMDLSGITSLVNGQFYVLEVRNSKGLKYYLKFKHND